MGFPIKNGVNADEVAVNANKQASVILETDVAGKPEYVGAVRAFSENDPGEKTGVAYLKSQEVSQDFRSRVGVDTVLFSYTFNATTQNTGLWKHAFTTMTMTQSAGFLNVNAAGTSTVSGNFAYLQTWRYFPLIGTAPICVEITGNFTLLPQVNEVFLLGLGVATGAAEPVDGIWLELTTDGLKGCIRYNSGVTAKTTLITGVNLATELALNSNTKYTIVVGEREIEYWMDDQHLGNQIIPVGQGQAFLSTTLPLFIQKYNAALVGSSPTSIFKVGDVTVTLMDIATNKTWAGQMAGTGLGLQTLDGGTFTNGAQQIQWANTALPTAAAGTNTTAALGAFLGGIFQLNAAATSATDIIISSYQNPLGSVNITARTMYIRGMQVDLVNAGAANSATVPTTYAVALAWGSTAASLATTESASFATGTTKIRRVQPLGVLTMPVSAVVGQAAPTSCNFDFEAPIVVNPGEFVGVIVKILSGAATASQVLQFVVSPNLYHE
jgi:hypothetical protein